MSISRKERKLLDEVLDVMRLHHYSIHTERVYCNWIKRYIQCNWFKVPRFPDEIGIHG